MAELPNSGSMCSRSSSSATDPSLIESLERLGGSDRRRRSNPENPVRRPIEQSEVESSLEYQMRASNATSNSNLNANNHVETMAELIAKATDSRKRALRDIVMRDALEIIYQQGDEVDFQSVAILNLNLSEEEIRIVINRFSEAPIKLVNLKEGVQLVDRIVYLIHDDGFS